MNCTYRLEILPINNKTIGAHRTISGIDGIAFIPFNPDNTDYVNFKNDLANGAQLNDAEGNPMTAEQITEFLGTLP